MLPGVGGVGFGVVAGAGVEFPAGVVAAGPVLGPPGDAPVSELVGDGASVPSVVSSESFLLPQPTTKLPKQSNAIEPKRVRGRSNEGKQEAISREPDMGQV
jgi:hypothetical protein